MRLIFLAALLVLAPITIDGTLPSVSGPALAGGPALDTNPDATEEGQIEARFDVDVPALIASFRTTGRVDLPAPVYGTVTVAGEEVRLFRPGGGAYVVPLGGGRADGVPVDMEHLALRGHVVDAAGARPSNVLLAAPGVYAVVFTQHHRLEYDPEHQPDGGYEQVVRMSPLTTAVPGSNSLAQYDDPAPDVRAPAITAPPSGPTTGPHSGPGELSVVGTRVLTEPWLSDNPAIVAFGVFNGLDSDAQVHIEAELKQENETRRTTTTLPVNLPSGAGRVLNVTLVAPAGKYELKGRLHALVAASVPSVADERSLHVEVLPNERQPTELPVMVGGAAGVRAAHTTEVFDDGDVLRIRPLGIEPCCNVIVDRSWLEGRFGSIASSHAWTSRVIDNQEHLVVPTSPRKSISFTSFDVGRSHQYTQGSEESVRLAERPMWLSLIGANTTTGPTKLILNITDQNTDGQDVIVNETWLGSFGVHEPTFVYPNGEVIPATRHPGSYAIHAPHFSIIMIYGFDCGGCTPNNPPPSTHWTVEAGSCCTFLIDDFFSVQGDQSLRMRGSETDGTQMWAYRWLAEGNIAPPVLEFWARLGVDNGQQDWHRFIWQDGTVNVVTVNLRTTGNGDVEVHSSGSGGAFPTLFQTNRWLLVRVLPNWSACTYELRVGHVTLTESLPFHNSQCHSSVSRIRLGVKGWAAEQWYLDSMAQETGAFPVSNVIMDVSQAVIDAHPDWNWRATSAFQQYDQMWQDSEISIVLSLYDVAGWAQNIITQDHCDSSPSPTEQYRDWLLATPGGVVPGVDAYQWWTGADLKEEHAGSPDGWWCFGQGRSERVGEGAEAASVVEGNDVNCCDLFDPDEIAERGIVSGHEFAHVFGEENHWDTCPPFQNCGYSMMSNGEVDGMDFWFKEWSKTEIRYRFHYDQEYGDPFFPDT